MGPPCWVPCSFAGEYWLFFWLIPRRTATTPDALKPTARAEAAMRAGHEGLSCSEAMLCLQGPGSRRKGLV